MPQHQFNQDIMFKCTKVACHIMVAMVHTPILTNLQDINNK